MVTFYAFRIMVGAGFLMLAMAGFGVVWVLFRGHDLPRWLWGCFALALVLPYIANSAGWILTEVGRQPWVVFGLMKTQYGVSEGVTPGEVLFSLSAFTLVYGLLAALTVFLIRRISLAGMPDSDDHD